MGPAVPMCNATHETGEKNHARAGVVTRHARGHGRRGDGCILPVKDVAFNLRADFMVDDQICGRGQRY